MMMKTTTLLFTFIFLHTLVQADDSVHSVNEGQSLEKPNNIAVKKEDVKKDEAGNYGKLSFTIRPSYMTIEGIQTSNGSDGILNSKLYTSYQLGYKHSFNGWVFGLRGSYKQVTFQQADAHTIMTPKHTLINYDLFAGRIFGDVFIGLGVGEDDKVFYKSLNGTLVDIETRRVRRAYMAGGYAFYKKANKVASLGLRLGVNPAEDTDTYKVKQGILYGAQLKYEYRFRENKTVGIEIFYNHDDYNTQKLNLTSSEIGLGVSFSYDWGFAP